MDATAMAAISVHRMVMTVFFFIRICIFFDKQADKAALLFNFQTFPLILTIYAFTPKAQYQKLFVSNERQNAKVIKIF